jgi:hypothetical protein
MSTLTIEYGFTDKAGKGHSGTIRNVPDGSISHHRLSRLVAAWVGVAPAEWDRLDCYSSNAVTKAMRERMAQRQPNAS